MHKANSELSTARRAHQHCLHCAEWYWQQARIEALRKHGRVEHNAARAYHYAILAG